MAGESEESRLAWAFMWLSRGFWVRIPTGGQGTGWFESP